MFKLKNIEIIVNREQYPVQHVKWRLRILKIIMSVYFFISASFSTTLCVCFALELRDIKDAYSSVDASDNEQREGQRYESYGYLIVASMCFGMHFFLGIYFARMGDRYCEVAQLD